MNKLNLSNLPTRLEKICTYDKNITLYIKRDDQTGFELSGNKIRKLDYVLKEAIELGCDTIITCGGVQSNHCRATAIAARKLGLKVHLVLKSEENDHESGNYFLDEWVGAVIHKISFEDYKDKRNQIMEDLKKNLGHHVYIIPEGASNGLGNLGYMQCYTEIIEEEKNLGVHFDYIVAAMGSGSTHAGLLMGVKANNSQSKVIGYNIYKKDVDAPQMIVNLIEESHKYLSFDSLSKEEVFISTDYVGRGYALNTKEELDFIWNYGKTHGILLDCVYTGKAMYGLDCDIKRGLYKENSNILFIHTGGVFGNFSKVDLFKKK